MTSPLELPGAVPGSEGGVAHFGNPLGEQRSFESGQAVAWMPYLGVLTLTGPDRLPWLHSLTSGAVDSLAPQDSRETLVLSPQGRIEFAVAVVDDGETTWLLAENAGDLAAWLTSMRFMMRVEITDRSEELAVVASRDGVDALVTWTDPWPTVLPGGTSYGSDPHPGEGWSLCLSAVERSRLGEVMAAGAAGTMAVEALRIAAGRPRFGSEVDHRTIPHELDWLRTAVHLHKGCYRGQETIARVHNLGRPPRRLVLLNLDGSDNHVPAPGDEVQWNDKTVGALTSVGYHHELGPLALALIKRNTPATEDLIVLSEDLSIAASQTLLVGTEGITADRPAARGPLAKLERKSLL